MPPPITEWFKRMISGEFLKILFEIWKWYFGDYFYGILILFTMLILYIRTRDLAFTSLVMLAILSPIAFLIAPTLWKFIYIIIVLGIASLLWKIVHR